ncbi:PilZ domain-containing protein [Vibrio sp. JC009]|uniref:PilZ domain-containing protein n=1 Tax=Vibrio sp. JC009 TaxID=2912314 RepID=UPI0023AE8AA7|nr:PilZ domain-containing protein [Vibrio sp. JC009]WED21497.1 PilZ domain-containing protein [Vibrio sp. JC009]
MRDSLPMQERRMFYRLRYPNSDRPSVEMLGQTFQVCEISELGMRLLFRSTEPVSLGVKVSGIVHFLDDEDVEIEGVALRQHGGEVAIKLSKGISEQRMTEERHHLTEKYPDVYPGSNLQPYKLNS